MKQSASTGVELKWTLSGVKSAENQPKPEESLELRATSSSNSVLALSDYQKLNGKALRNWSVVSFAFQPETLFTLKPKQAFEVTH